MFEVKKILHESDKFQQVIADDVQTWFEKITLTAFRNPVHNGLIPKVNIFCT